MKTKIIIPILLSVLTFYIISFFLDKSVLISLLISVTFFLIIKKVIAKIGFYKRNDKFLNKNSEKAFAVSKDGITRLKLVRKSTQKINNNKVALKIQEICKIGIDIFKNIEEHPEDLRKARQFTNYYLDATEKIVKQYIELSSKKNLSTEIEKTLTEVEETLDLIKNTFEKQIANLLTNDVLDLDTEIKVLKKTIKLEG